jgi:hypothetical protein
MKTKIFSILMVLIMTIMAIPGSVFASDPDCVAWQVANQDLSQIEKPLTPTREQWLWDLSAAHWTDDESRAGLIYNKFKLFLPT